MKRVARAAGITAAALVLVLVSLSFLVNANQFRPMLESELTKALGREVRVGNLKLAILSGGVAADDLSVADNPSFSRNPFLRARSLKVGVELIPLLFSRKLNVTGLAIDQPEIVLIQSPSGEWNFSNLGAKSAKSPAPPEKKGLDLSVRRVRITNGRLSLGKTGSASKPRVFENVNVQLSDFSATSVFPFSLSARVAGGGTLKLQGKAGPIDSADTTLTPVEASLSVAHLDLLASGFVERSSGVAGVISLDGTTSSDGRRLQTRGRIQAGQLRLDRNGSPARRPVEFDFAVDHYIQKHAGVLSRGNIHIGKAEAALTGSYTLRGETTLLNMKLAGAGMPVPELAAMLPALGIVLPAGSSLEGGTAHVNVTAEGPADRLITSGSLGLDRTRLAGFDLGSKIKTVATVAGIKAGPNTDIQTFSANVRAAPEGTTVQNLVLVAPAIGELSGAGTVSPSHALDFKMLVKLHTSGVVMTALGSKGDTSVPFFVRGTSSAPSFAPDVKGMASGQIQSILNRSGAAKTAGGFLDNLLGKKK